MNCKINFFFLTLLVFKAIVSIQGEEFLYEHDVTKQLDNWITRMFKVNSDTFKKLLNRIANKELETYSASISEEISPFGKSLNFYNVHTNVSEYISPKLNWKLSSNKMSLFLKEFTVRITGNIRYPGITEYVSFDTHLDMENITFSLSIDEDKVSYEFKYEDVWLWFNDDMKIYWTEKGELTNDNAEKLQKVFPSVLPNLLREKLKFDEHFSKSLKSIFHVYIDPKNKLIATHKDFFTSEQKYYYLIPKIPFFSFNLKNVIIRKLYNMEWLKINSGMSIFTHSLMIRNVQGHFILDFGTNQEKPVNLHFSIDYLSISLDKKSVNVDARCYSVNKTNTPLPYRQSALIMQGIETAVANSIFPTLEVRRTYEIDTPLEQIKITENTDWNTIKKSFHEWIPFNDDVKSPAGAGAVAGAPQTKM